MFFSGPVHAFGGIASVLVAEDFWIGLAAGIKKLSAVLLANSFD
jgi:hypothetical protein